MSSPTFLGIDCGTQSTKVIIYDPATHKILARGQAKHSLISRPDGTREQNSNWWVQALRQALASCPLPARKRIKVLSVSGQQHGFVPLDERGNPLYPAKLWCDTSTVKQCAHLTRRFGGNQKLLSGPGNLILSGYTAPKILWLKEHHPDLFRKLAHVLLPHDYLNYYLTGCFAMEYGDASGTGLLDVRTRSWNERLLNLIDPKLMRLLPPLIQPQSIVGEVLPTRARDLGLPAGILVASGGGDNMMGALGTGNNSNGIYTASLGTSGTLYGFSDRPRVDPQGQMAAFCSSSGGWLPLLCTMNCTIATELTKDLLKVDLKELEAGASQARPGCDGVTMLPYFNGERTPNLPNGRGTLLGLTSLNYNRQNLLRASMESAIYGLKLGLESFQRLGMPVREIRICGGGSKSKLWRQMAADIFGVTVTSPLEEESAAFGACLQALWAWDGVNGKRSDLNQILQSHIRLDPQRKHRPVAKHCKPYAAAYQRYLECLSRLKPDFQ